MYTFMFFLLIGNGNAYYVSEGVDGVNAEDMAAPKT